MISYILILMYLFQQTKTQSINGIMQSPCPETFYYDKQTEPGKWCGIISIHANEELEGLWISIKLDNRAELLGNWFGETYSSDNQEFHITNTEYILEAGSVMRIKIFVQYNTIMGPIPMLDTIKLNGKIICMKKNNIQNNNMNLHISKPNQTIGLPLSNVNFEIKQSQTNAVQPAKTGVVGSVNIDVLSNRGSGDSGPIPDRNSSSNDTRHAYPVKNIVEPKFNNFEDTSHTRKDVQEIPDMNYFQNKVLNVQVTPVSDAVNSPVLTINNTHEDVFGGDFNGDFQKTNGHNKVQEQPKDEECGTVAFRARPLITFGQDTSPGDWPWHAALYHTRGVQIVYICGGAVISKKYVLTAAHCVARPRSNKPVEAEDILIYLGKYSLKSFGPESQARDLSDIFIHPDYNYFTYYNDIALLKLSSPLEITDYVRPVCLWEETADMRNIVDKEGTVIGWGFDENKRISDKLMQAKMPIVSTNRCIESNKNFFDRYIFQNNFCAGFRNGTSVCNGDSGGEMVFPKKGTSGQNTVWQIRGLVSIGVALQTKGVCDVSQYVIFTDVAKYVDWIRRIVNENV